MRNNVTKIQKEMLIALSDRYDERLRNVLRRGDETSVVLITDQDAAICESFSEVICDKVAGDFPDYEGKDYDINQDAQLTVFLMSRLVAEYARENGL